MIGDRLVKRTLYVQYSMGAKDIDERPAKIDSWILPGKTFEQKHNLNKRRSICKERPVYPCTE